MAHLFDVSVTHHNGQPSFHVTSGVECSGTHIESFAKESEAYQKCVEESSKFEMEKAAAEKAEKEWQEKYSKMTDAEKDAYYNQ